MRRSFERQTAWRRIVLIFQVIFGIIVGEDRIDLAAEVSEIIPDSGDLRDIPFARVFYSICLDRRSGFLDVRDKSRAEGGKILKRVIISGGDAFAVQGGSVHETLGEILVSLGKITPKENEELKAEAGGDYGKIEQKIMTGAVVSPSELPDLVTRQVGLKIKNLFALIKGFYEFKDQDPESLMEKHALIPIAPGQLLLEGVREHYPAARVKKEYPDIERKTFSAAPGLEDSLGAFGCSAKTMKWLGEAPEKFSFANLVKTSPLGKDDAEALLLAFFFADLLMLPEGENNFPGPRAHEPKAAPPPKPVIEKKDTDTKESKPKDAAKAEGARKKDDTKLPIEDVLDKDLSNDEILKQISSMLEMGKDSKKNFFDLLGVERNSSASKIKQIYFKFAKKFHPDARPDLYKGKVKDEVEDLFTMVSEAYKVLSDDRAKAQYVKDLDANVSKADMEKASRAIEAEVEFQRAEAMLRSKNWKAAKELLERSVKLMPEEIEYQMYLAWADYRLEGHPSAMKAKNTIQKAMEKNPKLADAYYFLGVIFKNDGRLDEAEKNFAKAADMKPHDVDVKRELQIIWRQKEKADSQSKKGGFFKRKK